MTDLQRSMIAEARKRFDTILPIAFHTSLKDCFIDMGEFGGYFFFYNDSSGGTHVVRRDLRRDKISV